MLVVKAPTEAHANWSSRRRENETFMKIKRPKKCPKESSVCGENAFASGNRPSCTEIQRIIEKMKKSFMDRKRISISGLPKNFTQKVSCSLRISSIAISQIAGSRFTFVPGCVYRMYDNFMFTFQWSSYGPLKD